MHTRQMLFVACSVFLSWNTLSVSAQEVVRKMSKEDASRFTQAIDSLKQAKAEQIVCNHMLAEKQKMLKSLMSVMEKEHGLEPDKSYTFIAADNSLFQVSTNRVDAKKEPERKLIKKFKTKEEASPLVGQMADRQRIERQVLSLAELTLENRREAASWEESLKKVFNLESASTYTVKKISDSEYQLIRTPVEDKKPAEQTQENKVTSEKKDKKNK